MGSVASSVMATDCLASLRARVPGCAEQPEATNAPLVISKGCVVIRSFFELPAKKSGRFERAPPRVSRAPHSSTPRRGTREPHTRSDPTKERDHRAPEEPWRPRPFTGSPPSRRAFAVRSPDRRRRRRPGAWPRRSRASDERAPIQGPSSPSAPGRSSAAASRSGSQPRGPSPATRSRRARRTRRTPRSSRPWSRRPRRAAPTTRPESRRRPSPPR